VRPPLLKVEGLAKRFGALAVTDDVSFSVDDRRLVALIGPNGAGKTTLIDQLSGALKPDEGRIRFGDVDISALDMPARADLGLARSFQIAAVLPEYTALENVALAVQARSGSNFRFFGRAKCEEALNAPARAALERVGLLARAGDRAGQLSHGEKRALEIAIALALRPRLMLLDEPFAGLGSEETCAAVDLIRALKSKVTMLLVEHDMDAVFALADEIGVLVNGRLIAWGVPEAVRADARVRAAYLGEEELVRGAPVEETAAVPSVRVRERERGSACHPRESGGSGRRHEAPRKGPRRRFWMPGFAGTTERVTQAKPGVMLSVEAIEVGYDGAKVLHGVDFELGEGEALALVGRNGMGKTTTVRALFGLLPLEAGRILFEGAALDGQPPYVIARVGLGLAPEGRQAFPSLSVEENLLATARRGRGRWTLAEVFRLFPPLAERRRAYGDRLSGGEQQMLAIGRALMTNPKLIVLDEATEGLAPLFRAKIWDCLKRLKAEGQSILVIDKNLQALLDFVDRIAVIEKGRIVWRGSAGAFRSEPSIVERFLHLGGAPAPAVSQGG
jgi:branched-chain amino acid transport system ATP-binding protein